MSMPLGHGVWSRREVDPVTSRPLRARVREWLARRGAFVDADFWAIAMYAGPSPVDLHPVAGAAPAVGARDVTDVEAVFVADPFMLRRPHGWHMFFEVMNRRRGLGEIALASSDDGVNWAYDQVVLSEGHHLSYPQVFACDGEVFMVPETSGERAVRLYRAVEYPRRWELDTTLLTGLPFSDATVFHRDGLWWMLVETSPGPHFDTLRLYHAPRLHGPWVEHVRSPVRQDASSSRPAGRVLEHDGMLLRYSQDCSKTYGGSVSAHAITELTADSYREHRASPSPVLAPSGRGWNDAGMHHVDAHEIAPGQWLACVDGRPETGLRWPRSLPEIQRPQGTGG